MDDCLSPFEASRRLLYILKGIDPAVTGYQRSRGRVFIGPERQRRVYGKRVGASRNIDQSARRQAGPRERVTAANLCPHWLTDRQKAAAVEALREHWLRQSAPRHATAPSACAIQVGVPTGESETCHPPPLH